MSSPAGIDIIHSLVLSQEPKCMQTSWLQDKITTKEIDFNSNHYIHLMSVSQVNVDQLIPSRFYFKTCSRRQPEL